MKKKTLIVLVAAIGLLAACKSKSAKDYEFVNNSSSSLADSERTAIADAKMADTTKQPAEKLVKTADINIKVKDVRAAGENISVLIIQYGGMVTHQQEQSTVSSTRDVHISNDSVMRIASFSTTGEMTVRVPSDKLGDFITKVAHMGIYVNMSRMDVDDKSLDYLSNLLTLKDREELVRQQKTGKIRIKNPADVILLKDDMVDQRIDNMRTDLAVKYSVVGISLYQSDAVVKENIANDDPSAYNIPFYQRLGLAFASGWAIFIDIVVGLANIWVFIIIGLAVWRSFVYYKKRIKPVNASVK